MEKKILNINKGVTRKYQKDQGYFDGRFVERTEESKKVYTRKKKHKNDSWE